MREYYEVIKKFVIKVVPHIDEEEYKKFIDLIKEAVECAPEATVS